MLTTDEAYDQIASELPVIGVERVFLNELSGRRIAETVLATGNSPPFDNSAMDGWAVRHADGKASRAIVGEAAAGNPFGGEVGPGETARIFTGAPLPAGADTVIVQEDCTHTDEAMEPGELPERGSNIRWCGENIREGEMVIDVGDRVTPGDVAILASYRRSVFSVFRRPRVAIVTSGDELRELDQDDAPGAIVNSNAYMLEALVREAGADPVTLPIARDTMSDTRRAFADALATADLVISAGGVSVGDHDVVGLVIEELAEGQSHFWKVQMKPGKPLAFARSEGGTPILGLPGNPISSFVGFQLFAGPAIRMLQGVSPESARLHRVAGVSREAFGSTPRREQFVMGTHAWSKGRAHFTAFPHQSSGNLRLLRGATALGVVPVGVDRIEADEPLELVLLPHRD